MGCQHLVFNLFRFSQKIPPGLLAALIGPSLARTKIEGACWRWLLLPLLTALTGCQLGGGVRDVPVFDVEAYPPSSVTVQSRDPFTTWEVVADVLDDYFVVEREEPVRVLENLVTEGRIDTFPQVGATIFEPWRQDSVGPGERLYATLQSVRRRAVARVIPQAHSFRVELTIFKELEDVGQSCGMAPASFRNDTSLTRVGPPSGSAPVEPGWIPLGRDLLLEQQILDQIAARLGQISPPSTWGSRGNTPSPSPQQPIPRVLPGARCP